MDEAGRELTGRARRFHTLASLGLAGWEEADARHLDLVMQACRGYFQRNPYDRWFRKLDRLLAGTGTSYYVSCTMAGADVPSGTACHLDLIPYATLRKWMELTPWQRERLLARSRDALGTMLRDSPIQILVLNGQSVVEHFEALIGVRLGRREQYAWTLPRKSTAPVRGMSYRGVVRAVGRAHLGRDLLVLGYNHNIQSSFGVTTGVLDAVADWVGTESAAWSA